MGRSACTREGRRRGGAAAGAWRGGPGNPAPSSGPAHLALFYSPGRRRRRLTLCPLRVLRSCSRWASQTLAGRSPCKEVASASQFFHCGDAPARATFSLGGVLTSGYQAEGTQLCHLEGRPRSTRACLLSCTTRDSVLLAVELVPSPARSEQRLALEKWRGAVAAAASTSLAAR